MFTQKSHALDFMAPYGSVYSLPRWSKASGVCVHPTLTHSTLHFQGEQECSLRAEGGLCLSIQQGQAGLDPSTLLPSAPLAGEEGVEEAPRAGNPGWGL